jgi:collagenase-like PrtC family protease
MIIYEDENGTHVFTKYVLNLLTQLPDLQKIGLDTIRIDTFLHNED